MTQLPATVAVEETGPGPYTQTIATSGHVLLADEPQDMGGLNLGPAPYDFLLSALGACTSMTLRMYANQKKWPLQKILVRLTHHKETDAEGKKRDIITREITVDGPLDETQRQRLLEIANKCPIHRTLESSPNIVSTIS